MTPTSVIAEGRFFCSAEWHLKRMKSRFACPLYNWARKLSKQSGGVFYASAEHVAEYFGVDRKTALSALAELAESGFFVIDRTERFKPNTYRVIDHKEWAKRHPGRCVEKESFPWSGDGDPLGRELYAISGGRVKFWPKQMTGLRNLGFSDEDIIKQFRIFIDRADYTAERWKHAYYDFYASLKAAPTVGVDNDSDGEFPLLGVVKGVGDFPDLKNILRERKQGSAASSPTDSVRVQSNGPHRVQSNSSVESSRTDPSSRSSSSRKEVGEPELTIPAAPLASNPAKRVFKKKENHSEQVADCQATSIYAKMMALVSTFPAPSEPVGPQTPEEFEARRQLLQAQSRQLKRAAGR